MKQTKTKCIALIVMLVTVVMSIMPVATAGQIVTASMPDTLIEDTIIHFFENKDLGKENTLGILAQPIASYLKDKCDTQAYVCALYQSEKENYKIELVQKQRTDNGLQIVYKYQVIATFNYKNSPDLKSTRSEIVEVKYDKLTAQIVDLYSPLDYYDMAIRNDSSYFDGNTMSETKIQATDIKMKQIELRNQIANVHAEQTAELSLEERDRLRLTASALNTTSIVNYARANYDKYEPASGDSSISYYDFSEITGAYDCTNFVSHALLAGGAEMNDPGGSGIGHNGWYYRSSANRSRSWAGVNELHEYLVNNTTANTLAGSSVGYTHNGGYWGIGNVLQISFGGTEYDHSTIITEKRFSDDGLRAYAYCTGRTGDDWYNDNVRADDAWPNASKRTISVYNN